MACNRRTYSIEKDEGTLKITPVTDKVTVTITGNNGSMFYDGNEHSVTGYTTAIDNQLYTVSDFTFTGEAIAKGTDADSYQMGLNKSQFANNSVNFANVEFVVNDGALTVTPRPVTITAKSANFTYDGQTHTLPEAEITGLVGNDAITVTVVGEIRYPTATPVVNEVKGYEFTAGKASNYSVTTANGELTMSWPTAQKVVVTANSATKTYDGTPLTDGGYTVEFGGQTYHLAAGQSQELANGDVLTVQIEGSVTDVEPSPTANKIVSVSIMNGTTDVHHIYNVQKENGKLQVTPMPLTVTADSGSKVYDGTALTKNSYTSTDPAAGDTLASVTVTGSQTNAGSSENIASGAKLMRGDRDVTANYAIEYLPGTLTVTPVTDKVTVTITGYTDTVTYNGAERSVTGYETAISNPLYKAENFTFSGTATAKGTDAGSYAMGLTPEQFENTNPNFENVTFIVTDGWLKIDPMALTITADSDSKVYDGTALTKNSYTSTAPAAGDTLASVTVTGSQTDVGSSDNVASDAKLMRGDRDVTANYAITYEKGTLAVTPLTDKVTVTITGNKSTVTYNGAEQSVTGYKVESISNPLYTAADFAFSGTASVTGTDAGSYPMGLTAEQFKNTSKNFTNVKFVVNDGELTINPMALTITAGSDSKAYDGTPLTCGKFDSTTPAEGDTVTSVTLTGSQTNVGSSDNVASDAKLMRGDRDVTANYAIEYVDGKLTVTKNESAKLTADAYRGVYDGAAHDAVVKTTITGAVEGDSWTYAYSLDGENYTAELPQVKNVGAYPVWVKATNDNYVDLVTVVTAEVTPATVLVTADSHEWIIAVKDTCVSDPEPALTYQAESPVAGETPAFSGELSREPGTERGKTYQILQGDLALADGENFLASNYVLQFVPGELTVKARDITITKTVDVTKAFVGDKLTYTITVTNTGDVDLQDVAVVDEMLGIEQVIGELKAGESWTQQFTYTAQESDAGKTLVNTAVTGTKDEKTFDQVDSDGTEITQKPVPTGDQSMVGLWTATLLISAAGAAIILARKSTI